MSEEKVFNPPPGWPQPPKGWIPPRGWEPDPSWPDPPEGWELWITDGQSSEEPENVPEDEPAVSTGNKISQLEREVEELKGRLRASAASGSGSSNELDDHAILTEVGIYRYHHPLETAVAYKDRLAALNTRIAELVKSKKAIQKSEMFTYDNSLAKGRKMSDDLAGLMLRAYNAEVENCLRSLRAGNLVLAKKRIVRSRDSIAKLGKMMEMRISDLFHLIRLEEVELTADYLMKKQEEKETAREERARLREEKRVAAELAAEREQLDKERQHLLNALQVLEKKGEVDQELKARLETIDEAITQNDYRAANIRAGYVYVISNQGAFGEGVLKIGLTRRLEPLNRIDELSGASVPFRFDVHGLFFSEDAVALEHELHQHFSDRRVNLANPRKEFFFVTPAEVRCVLEAKVGNLLEFNEEMDGTEFFQSLSQWPKEFQAQAGREKKE